jgi:hypothetical protein
LSSQRLTGIDPESTPVVNGKAAEMGEPHLAATSATLMPSLWSGALQLAMRPLHPHAAQITERRGIQVPPKCRLQAAWAKPGGPRNLTERDRVGRMLVNEAQRTTQRQGRVTCMSTAEWVHARTACYSRLY